MNQIQTWQQGKFINFHKYDRMSEEWKQKQEKRESLLVRSGQTDNAICQCNKPEDAIWIAKRLNLASVLEQMAYDYAIGKADGSEIVKMVHNSIK